MLYLIGLVWIALVVGVFWYYKNIREKREIAHREKFREMLTLTNGGIPSVVSPAPLPRSQGTLSAVPRQPVVKKKRVLDAANTLLYYVLRTGISDHEIFIDISLSRLIEGTALPNARVSFVVCNKGMEIIAVVMSSRETRAIAVEQQLESAGIRIVHLDAAAPPRHHEVRALIYGA